MTNFGEIYFGKFLCRTSIPFPLCAFPRTRTTTTDSLPRVNTPHRSPTKLFFENKKLNVKFQKRFTEDLKIFHVESYDSTNPEISVSNFNKRDAKQVQKGADRSTMRW